MPKYNYKKDALNAYMRGKISAKELDKIAKKDFGSSVATKKELQSFLDAGYMQKLMANTYNLKVPQMVKKVKDLMKFAESINEASRGEIFSAAKKGSYPATVIVSQVRDMKSKIIKQVTVKTPAEAPATIKVLQKKYPKGDYKISLEDRTGKIIFKESVNEAMKPSQVSRAISRMKKVLMKKWQKRGGYENFGQRELDVMKDKLNYNPYGTPDERKIAKMLDGLDNWAMNYDGNMREGKKRYYQQDRVGSAKYTISYHDGKKKHKDGSDFFDIQTFKNKKDLAKFVNTLHKGGYVYGFNESVNEAYVVLYSPKKGVKPVTTAAYKDKKDAEKWAKDLGGITMIVKKKVKGIDESLYESKTKESKVIQKIYQYSKTEKKFYDELAKHEVRIGQRDYAKFIINALKGFGINPREFKRIPDAEEKLYQTVSSKNEDLRNWFKSKWVNIGKKDKSGKHPPCGTSGKKRGYAKCVPAAKAATMSKKEKESATRRKRAAQNKSNRGGKSSAGQGKKPINVSTHTGGRKSGTGKGS